MTPPTEIRLRLSTLRTFFDAEEADPFDGVDTDLSGIDQLMAALTARRTGVHRLVVDVPERPDEDDLAARLPRALRTYCHNKIKYCRKERSAVWGEGRRALRVGIVFLAVCLGLSAGVEHLLREESPISYLIAEGLLIAGWVGLWHPMELLLYAWWPFSRDIKLYQKIQGLTVQVHRRPAEG